MCGICGIVSLDQERKIDPNDIQAMCDKMIHRGPDSDGYYIKHNVALGMRRLRIIDLNTGDQPILNEDKTISVIFNGEIYNFIDLRTELIRKGHKFYTQTDTEVIVHLYEEYGENFLNRLRGMFALAIWDQKEEKLLLARDRLGIKPLYYALHSNFFIFASELKSILTFRNFNKELDTTSMSDYFTLLYVPAPRTIFKKIRKLLPGHYLRIEQGRITTRKYWDLNFKVQQLKSVDDYIHKFLNLFEESVRLRMISDVPLGAFLSGGIDSSLVVAMMSKLSQAPVETFTIGYKQNGKYFDETHYARLVADIFRTNHHEFHLQPSKLYHLLDKVITHFDEPFADASAIPNYLLSSHTRKHVTVSLSGLGGDELCGGYERYRGCLLAEKYRKLPALITQRLLPSFVNKLPDSKDGKHFTERLKRFINTATLSFLPMYFNVVATFNETEKQKLFSPDTQNQIQRPTEDLFTRILMSPGNGKDLLNHMSNIDLNTYLVDDLLTLTDRMSMAHSLEVRVPFLDHKLVEFFATIPPKMKIKGLTKKFLLKKAAERFLPKELIYRPKMGFSVPLVLWFRNDLRSYVTETILDNELMSNSFFNKSYVSATLNEHFSNKRNHDEKIWALINFVKWYEKYIL